MDRQPSYHSSVLNCFQINCLKLLLAMFILNCCLPSCSTIDPPVPDKEEAHLLPPCQACKNLVNSFIKGMERTSRGKFEGGDADWEESRLGNYATSEVRLIEIQEKLCSDVTRGQNQCHNLAEVHESLIEDWWFKQQKTHPNLHEWLCINQLTACCPDHHYGPDCKPCPGFPDECNGNGRCKGSGTRKGNGQCVCDKGYAGETCQQCSSGFYSSYKDEKKNLCSPCHKSCKDVCTQAGPKGCVTCNSGWTMDTEFGCSDVDECLANSNVCKGNTFCVNSPGSFSCLACDKACDGCSTDGPDSCDKCAEGYNMKDGICSDASIDSDRSKDEL